MMYFIWFFVSVIPEPKNEIPSLIFPTERPRALTSWPTRKVERSSPSGKSFFAISFTNDWINELDVWSKNSSGKNESRISLDWTILDGSDKVFLGKVVLKKRNQIYRKTTTPKWDLNKLWYGGSSANMLHIFRTTFYMNTSRELLLTVGKLYISW